MKGTKKINSEIVDLGTIEIDNLEFRDYPDFSNAYISYGEDVNGNTIKEKTMEIIMDEHPSLFYELIENRIY